MGWIWRDGQWIAVDDSTRPKGNNVADLRTSLLCLTKEFEKKVKHFSREIEETRPLIIASRELGDRLRANTRDFKDRVESFETEVDSAESEVARRANPLLEAFNALIVGQAERTEAFAKAVDEAISNEPEVILQQAPDFVAFDELVAKFRDLVEDFGDDLAAQAPTLPLPEREQLLASFEDLIKSFEDLLKSRLELVNLNVQVSNQVRFGRLQKIEELIRSIEDLLLSLEDLIESLIDLSFKPVQKAEELLKSIEDLIKSFEDLAQSSFELDFKPIQKLEELLKSLEDLIKSFQEIVRGIETPVG